MGNPTSTPSTRLSPGASSPSSSPIFCRSRIRPPRVLLPNQHFSDLRTTTDSVAIVMCGPECSEKDSTAMDCSCVNDEAVAAVACGECVRECEVASCSVELTSQCTDQCVVVACNDAHHPVPLFSAVPAEQPCDTTCLNSPDCATFDEFLQCCADAHESLTQSMLGQDNLGMNNSFGPWDFEALLCSCTDSSSTVYSQASSSSNQSPVDSVAPSPQIVASVPFQPQPAISHPVSPIPSLPSSQSHIQHPAYPLGTAINPSAQSGPLRCMWGDCGQTFTSLNELVGHVNLQHLRLPGPGPAAPNPAASLPSPPSTLPSAMPYQQPPLHQQTFSDPTSLSCLWADCQQYPNPQSIPGTSSSTSLDNALGFLATHLLHDHLGVSGRGVAPTGAPPFAGPEFKQVHGAAGQRRTPPRGDEPIAGPPTPVPEHDCSQPSAHVCRWRACTECFMSCDELTAHIAAVHVGGGRAHYDCYWEGCNRHGELGFASKQKISRHLQSHTGHRPFQCTVCGQNFSEAATLAQHMRRHTQEKPYVCDFPGCGKAFAITGALTIHKRTHNGNKPFKCTYCDKAFAESSNLSKHLRTHTGVRPYTCPEPGCNKAFARPDQLQRHMKVHGKKGMEAANPRVSPSGTSAEVIMAIQTAIG
ncbi:hypothetical protein CERSUDRAFT_134205 [Gelatoporia subvermispora B]|uniref:C2H2-type domain-containing protein n=1 Tax=Ceriporiopsis subvermispora (strain B) TaxID=914234 RepID=M2RK74_CERS8|nr:hypothetical protein CERSUDRAFT_134205 [Gelatoporia subvermispora B]